ncbi:MAG: tetratricopeptide repeat protein, partial [Campylobacteraceae bacterium]
MKKVILIIYLITSSILANEILEKRVIDETKACIVDDYTACENLGLYYETGTFLKNVDTKIAVDLNKALFFYDIACYGGNISSSCEATKDIHENYEEKNLISCEKNVAQSCNLLGVHYGYTKKDFDKSISYFKKACELKNSWACLELSTLYSDIKKDNKKAKEFVEKSCELNNDIGCNDLGFFYQFGIVTEENIDKAINVYSISCNGLKGFGCLSLGRLLLQKGDIENARFYLNKACKDGYEPACKEANEIKISQKESSITRVIVWDYFFDGSSPV